MANKSDRPDDPNPKGYSSLDRAAKVADENAMKVVARDGRFFVEREKFKPEEHFGWGEEKEPKKREFKKGGLSKKPKFMKGGSYKGKSHMYAAGGMVKELKI